MENFNSSNGQFYWWFGVVEDRNDPLRMGRCRVRILGYHVDDLEILPTEDLPWAMPVMPANSASSSGVGWSPTGAVEGSWVVGFFADGPNMQHPMFWGTVGAVPGGLAGTGCSDGEAGSGEPGSPESDGSSPAGGYGPASAASPQKEFWTLVAICSREAGDAQDQCDVAQSIYNRSYCGRYGARTLAGVILASGQYEPVFSNPGAWAAINSAETAARATRRSVNTMREVARRLKRADLQAESARFVGGKTDFLGYSRNNSTPMTKAYNRGSLVCRDPKGVSPNPATRSSATRNKFGYNNDYTGRNVAPIPDVVRNTSAD